MSVRLFLCVRAHGYATIYRNEVYTYIAIIPYCAYTTDIDLYPTLHQTRQLFVHFSVCVCVCNQLKKQRAREMKFDTFLIHKFDTLCVFL